MVWRGAVLQETDSNDKAEKMTEDMILTARQAEYWESPVSEVLTEVTRLMALHDWEQAKEEWWVVLRWTSEQAAGDSLVVMNQMVEGDECMENTIWSVVMRQTVQQDERTI